jgi:polysaccharide pyruvyl transferase WcaK-like protein
VGKPKVVITHSWSKNMGDAAMLMVITRMLKEMAPGCEVSALVSHPGVTAKGCHGLEAGVESWIWPIPRQDAAGPLELAGYPFIFANNMLSAAIFRLTGRRLFLFNRRFAPALNRFFDADVIISPGGDFLGPAYFFPTALGEFIMAGILGKRSIICAQTIGPMQGFFQGWIVAPVLRLVDLVIVREERSLRDLGKIGVSGAVVTSDLVFGLGQRPVRERGRTVVLCPKKIFRGRQRYMESYRELARRVIDDLGYGVVFLPTDHHDVSFQREIASGVGRPAVEVIGEVEPPEAIADRIASSEFVISTRMHAIILGTLSRTPFFAIGDSHKFKEILGPLCGDCVIDVADFNDEGIVRIIRSVRGKDALGRKLAAGFPRVRERALENGRLIRGKLGEWGLI